MVRIIVACFVFGVFLPLQAEGKKLEQGNFKARVGEATLAYTVAGKGPAMLVLPNSWGLEKERLQAMFAPLEQHFTMIYFDMRGMGGSSAAAVAADRSAQTVRRDANALRQALGLDKVYLLGWSAGAMNGMLYAAEHSEHLRGAVLVSGIAYVGEEEAKTLVEKHGGLFQRRAEKMAELAQSTASAAEKDDALKRFVLEEWFPYMCADRQGSKTLMEKYLGPGNFSWAHMQYLLEDFETFDAREMLPRIGCPVLVVAGAQDLLPPEFLKKDSEAMPQGSFASFPQSGHYAMVEEPEAFVATVLAWRYQPKAE